MSFLSELFIIIYNFVKGFNSNEAIKRKDKEKENKKELKELKTKAKQNKYNP